MYTEMPITNYYTIILTMYIFHTIMEQIHQHAFAATNSAPKIDAARALWLASDTTWFSWYFFCD